MFNFIYMYDIVPMKKVAIQVNKFYLIKVAFYVVML